MLELSDIDGRKISPSLIFALPLRLFVATASIISLIYIGLDISQGISHRTQLQSKASKKISFKL